jgi:hypothetical protein
MLTYPPISVKSEIPQAKEEQSYYVPNNEAVKFNIIDVINKSDTYNVAKCDNKCELCVYSVNRRVYESNLHSLVFLSQYLKQRLFEYFIRIGLDVVSFTCEIQ